MARTVTFAALRELVRGAYDLPDLSSLTWLNTTYANSLINASLQSYYGLLIELYGENYFAASSTITTTINTELSSLPSRCIKVTKLWWERGADDIVPILRGTLDDMVLASYDPKSWTEYGPKFRLSGTASIQWLPTPSAAYTVRCDHVALPADLSADGDTFEANSGHEFFVVNDVCAKLAIREEKDPSVWWAERERFAEMIRQQAGERDEGEPLTLRDAYRQGESDYQRRNRLTRMY